MDEQLLIDGCMRGESWARKELYEQYAPAMMSVCMRYVGDRETARDLLQDGFVKIFTKIRSYSGSGAFGGGGYGGSLSLRLLNISGLQRTRG